MEFDISICRWMDVLLVHHVGRYSYEEEVLMVVVADIDDRLQYTENGNGQTTMVVWTMGGNMLHTVIGNPES